MGCTFRTNSVDIQCKQRQTHLFLPFNISVEVLNSIRNRQIFVFGGPSVPRLSPRVDSGDGARYQH